MEKRGKETERISKWVFNVKYEDIPRRTIKEAKIQILNILASLFAGYQTKAGKVVLKTVSSWGGKEECTIIPSGKKTTLHQAIFANCSLSMALDYDDYLFAGHSGHSAVLVPLTLAERFKISGKDLLLSQIIANEVEGRIGASVILGPQNGQLWSFLHLIGAALSSAKALRLNPEQTLNALGISLYQPNFSLLPGFMGSAAKILTATTAVNGVIAAELARDGLTGPSDILENEKGFWHYFSYLPLPYMIDGLGEVFLTDTLSYKVYPGCAYIDSAIDCVLKIVNSGRLLNPEEIKKVEVFTNLLTMKMDQLSSPFLKREKSEPVTLNFFLPYNLAVALIDKELTPRQLRPERIKDKKVWQLVDKIELHHETKFTQELMEALSKVLDYKFVLKNLNLLGMLSSSRDFKFKETLQLLNSINPESLLKEVASKENKPDFKRFNLPMGARVRILMKDGREVSATQEIPQGAGGRPQREKRQLVEKKFEQETKAFLSHQTREKVKEIIENLEEARPKEIRKMIGLLCS